MTKNTNKKTDIGYGFYSRVLNKPFDTLDELKVAEQKHYDELKAKENKVATKKADAKVVEDAFKALNAARRIYKEKLNQLTTEYTEELTTLKKAYELGKKDIQDKLSEAELAYKKAIKDFGDKYPEGYHMTLKDGDFETTISRSTKVDTKATAKDTKPGNMFDLVDLLFGWH